MKHEILRILFLLLWLLDAAWDHERCIKWYVELNHLCDGLCICRVHLSEFEHSARGHVTEDASRLCSLHHSMHRS